MNVLITRAIVRVPVAEQIETRVLGLPDRVGLSGDLP